MYTIVKVNNLTHELTILNDGERINFTIPETHSGTAELKKEYIEAFLQARKAEKEIPLTLFQKAQSLLSTPKLLPYMPYLLTFCILEAVTIVVLVIKGR